MYKIGIIGFGVVGRGIASILHEKRAFLRERYGFEFQVTGIADIVWGSVYNGDGINLKRALELVNEGKKIDELGEPTDALGLATKDDIDIILEITPTNIETGEPGYTHIKTALQNGKHVATTNKGPIALFLRELEELAASRGVELRYEGTVLSGTPTINLALKDLAGLGIEEIRGIVNGTTNFILTEMEKGKSYDEALKKAQKLGYAEAKPDADVLGFDAQAKAVILANVVLGGNLKPQDVEREGITGLKPDDVERAKSLGKRWKLIARAWKERGVVKARVKPEMVGPEDFLYHVVGVTNAVVFKTDYLHDVTIVGPGAGSKEAGYALLVDMLDIHRVLKGGS